jgi:type I restriction enzyme M protein
MLAADVIEAVVGLAPNLFYGAGIPAALLVCRKNKPVERLGKVSLFIDETPGLSPTAAQQLPHPSGARRTLPFHH